MKKIKKRWNRKGFTLIEVIITLVLLSIMGAMLVTFSRPLLNSAGAFGWLNDELILQQSMEKIIGDYKSQRNNPYNPYNPSSFRQYIINKYPLVDAGKTGFVTFTCNGTAPNVTCTSGWPPTASIPSGSEPLLIVTVTKNKMTLSMILT